MYELGRELWSRRVRLLAMALALTLPMACRFRELRLDPPLAAMTALYALDAGPLQRVLQAELLARPRIRLRTGVAHEVDRVLCDRLSFMLALLGRQTLSRDWIRPDKDFAIAVGLALFISLPWYLAHVNLWIRDIRRGWMPSDPEGDPEVLSFQSAHWYLSSIFNEPAVSPPLCPGMYWRRILLS